MGETLNITLESGDYDSMRTYNALLLTASSDDAVWHFDGAALRALARSGIPHLTLAFGDKTVRIDTENGFSGLVYSAMRAEGHTDNTFVYTVSDGEIAVDIGGSLPVSQTRQIFGMLM